MFSSSLFSCCRPVTDVTAQPPPFVDGSGRFVDRMNIRAEEHVMEPGSAAWGGTSLSQFCTRTKHALHSTLARPWETGQTTPPTKRQTDSVPQQITTRTRLATTAQASAQSRHQRNRTGLRLGTPPGMPHATIPPASLRRGALGWCDASACTMGAPSLVRCAWPNRSRA